MQPAHAAWVLLFLCLWSLPTSALAAEEPPAAKAEPELVWELDAYYSNLELHIPLTDQPTPDAGEKSEAQIYRDLFLHSLKPRLLLLEGSVYPMPVLGTYLRKHHSDFYENSAVGDFNPVQSVTAGFQEPAAVSVFFGNAMNFVKPGAKRKGTNKGFIGYLFSAGSKHIKANVLIDDDWHEFEWKLKGERDFEDERLSWSFRLGAKTHGNPDITDVAYIGLRRSNLNYNTEALSLQDNTSVDCVLELTQGRFAFARGELVVGKTYPLKNERFALALDVGFIVESPRKYSGGLRDNNGDTVTIVFRPNIQF